MLTHTHRRRMASRRPDSIPSGASECTVEQLGYKGPTHTLRGCLPDIPSPPGFYGDLTKFSHYKKNN